MGLEIIGSSGSSSSSSSTHQPTVLLFGDSITFAAGSIGTAASPVSNGAVASTFGFWTWAAVRMRYGLRAVANKGVGGNTTAQMLARLDADVLQFTPKPGWVLVNGYANDAAAGTPTATTISNLTSICDQIRAAGMGVILTAALPKGATPTGQGKINRALQEYTYSKPDVIWVDWYSQIADPSEGTFHKLPVSGSNGSHVTDDQIHPNAGGASKMGKVLADTLTARGIYPKEGFTFGSNVDAEQKLANPGMVGTSGTIGTASGVVATNWTSRYGANATLSKVARTDGIPGEWQQVTYAGPGYQQGDMYYQFSGLTVGDIIVAAVEFELDVNTIPTTYLTAACANGATTLTVDDTTAFPSSGFVMLNGGVTPVTYTGKTATTFTGCANVSGQTAGSPVSGLYDLSMMLKDSSAVLLGSCLRQSGNVNLGSGEHSLPSSGVLMTQPTAATTTGGYMHLNFGTVAGTMRWGRASLLKVA